MEQVLARYHLDDISQMKPEHYRDAMSGLKKSKPDCCSLTGVKGIAKMSIEELIQMILGERINSALQETSLERDKG